MWPFEKKEPTAPWKYTPLAVYHAEQSRGLVHTKKYAREIRRLKKDYTEWLKEVAKRNK